MADRDNMRRCRTVITVSGEIPVALMQSVSRKERPYADYLAIADETGGDLVDRAEMRARATVTERLAERVFGPNVAMALQLFRTRDEYDVLLTDGEQVGLPLAGLLQFAGPRRPRHVMIGHRVSARKKRAVTRLLGLTRGVDEVLVYSTNQLFAGQDLFHRPGQSVTLIDFMVDTQFFQKQTFERRSHRRRPLVVSAGREGRDYPTMIDAVSDLDVDVVIASASPWSRRADNAGDVALPSNVTITSMNQKELRDLYDRADLVVVPLKPVDFQAGVTTILEAMAMEVPVVCTAAIGQVDVLVEGETGRYVVGPGDVREMRRVIKDLLGEPDLCAQMGKAARKVVEERADVHFYARTIASRLVQHASDRELSRTRPRAVVT